MAGNAPNTTILSKLYYGESLNGEKIQVAYVQEIPDFDQAPEGIEWSALDTDYTGQEPGRKSGDTIPVPVLFTKTQHSQLKALDKSKIYYWFILLPDDCVDEGEEPPCFYFQAKVRLGMNALAIDEMIQETLTLYKTSAVEESEGLPETTE